jgi:hypothetical protein
MIIFFNPKSEMADCQKVHFNPATQGIYQDDDYIQYKYTVQNRVMYFTCTMTGLQYSTIQVQVLYNTCISWFCNHSVSDWSLHGWG